MSSRPPFYVTTPIYYVNDMPHLGHTYTTVVADALARFQRMRGHDVRFLTGTDEHGINIQRAAARQGMAPIDLATRVVERYHSLWRDLDITCNDFIRTTQARHAESVQALWRRVRDAGDLYLGSYGGWYCAACEAFYPEGQLVEGRCPVHERPTEWIEEPSWFFRLSKYQQPLLDLYRERPEFILPATRRNEIVSFVESGLKDLSVSRASLKWGVPVPDDPDHVVYVWFDALANYISALGYGSQDDTLYTLFWKVGAEKSGRLARRNEPGPAAGTTGATGMPSHPLHLVGKDILRFHSVYWPAFLLAAGEPVPGTIFAHGWWLADEKKMSKTIGNVVRPGPIIRAVGAEPLRWFLLREMTFGLDGTYSDEALIERANADLANTLGNLLSRVVTLIARRPGGALAAQYSGAPFPEVVALREMGRQAHERWITAFERCEFSLALEAAIGLLAELNRLLVVHQPWKAAEDSPEGSGARLPDWSILFEAGAALRMAAVWLAPVCPRLARGVWAQLGLGGDPGAADILESFRWEDCPALIVRPGAPLFQRLDKTATLAALAREIESESENKTMPSEPTLPPPDFPAAPAPPTPPAQPSAPAGVALIGIEQFQGIELRVGRITACERVPKADRLLKLQVDIGSETRQIVSGIAESYSAESLIGRTTVIVVNLKPAVLRGVESRGMLLAAEAGGRISIVTFDEPVPAPGTRVK